MYLEMSDLGEQNVILDLIQYASSSMLVGLSGTSEIWKSFKTVT